MRVNANSNQDQSLVVDISDALSERDRVRFTVHTRTKLPQFAKQNMSVVRQHEEFIWLHDCLEDNDQYAGYIIPPAPPKPDFDASREKLQRLGDGEASMTKEEFAKMKQELEAEYLAIFKKTVAMHEIFLQRLAAHEKFREDNNFKIFLEYENELAVRCKSKKERLAGSLQNISKSLTDFVITTSQVAATTSASSSLITGVSIGGSGSSSNQSPIKRQPLSSLSEHQQQQNNGNNNLFSDIGSRSAVTSEISSSTSTASISNQEQQQRQTASPVDGDGNNNIGSDEVDEQYFEKERLFLALYYNSIRDTAIQADKVTQLQKCLADNYLHIAQQLVRLAGIEVLPITAQTKDTSNFVACKLPSLTLPASLQTSDNINDLNASSSSSLSLNVITKNIEHQEETSKLKLIDQSVNNQLETSISLDDDEGNDKVDVKGEQQHIATSSTEVQQPQTSQTTKSITNLALKNTSEGLKQLLLHVSDYFEQARKIETRVASDEDLKLTDTFLYYKRDTLAAQDLLVRRLRFLAEYDTATKNLEKARQKGRTQMQYAELIQKQAKENFISISKLAKRELNDYKQRRVASFRKSFTDLVELELKHLKSHSQLIMNCLKTCRGIVGPGDRQAS